MDNIEWSDWLNLKIPSIDKEHRRLFDFIRQLNHAIIDKTEHEVLNTVLEGMVKYSEYHFQHEEDLFAIHKYPDEQAHKNAHKHYVAKINEFTEAYKSGESINPNLVLIFLNNWWMNHITNEDRAYSEFLIKKGVQ